jgi:hypothetical protein
LRALNRQGCRVPFDPTLPRSFTAIAVRNYAPDTSGVYGLSNAREWIYIGESDNIQAALLAHLSDRDSELMRLAPKGFVLETCDRARRLSRQERLIGEYRPLCNERLRENA